MLEIIHKLDQPRQNHPNDRYAETFKKLVFKRINRIIERANSGAMIELDLEKETPDSMTRLFEKILLQYYILPQCPPGLDTDYYIGLNLTSQELVYYLRKEKHIQERVPKTISDRENIISILRASLDINSDCKKLGFYLTTPTLFHKLNYLVKS